MAEELWGFLSLQAVCNSCMLADSRLSGENVTLCPLCYEEREVGRVNVIVINCPLPLSKHH